MTNTTSSALANVKWMLAPEVADSKAIREALFKEGALRFPEWTDSQLVKTIKSGAHRSVYQISLPGLDIHLKHNRISGPRSFFREYLRATKAQNEFQMALNLLALGIPTIVPLAFGKSGGFLPESFIITHTLENSVPLNEYWESLENKRWDITWDNRHELVRTLAVFLAALHRKGVVHTDLHPGNLMVETREQKPARIIMLDLHPVKLHSSSVPWNIRLENLAMLDRWAALHSTLADRMRLWDYYTREVTEFEGSNTFAFKDKHWMKRQIGIMKALEFNANLKLWSRFDPRCLGNNRRFKKFKLNNTRGHHVAELGKDCLLELVKMQSSFEDVRGLKILKKSKSSEVASLTINDGETQRRIIYKKIFATKSLDPFLSLFRQDGTSRSWTMGNALLIRQLPTPKPLAVWHTYTAGLQTDGVIITEEISNAMDLPGYLTKIETLLEPERTAALRAVVFKIANLIRKMHDLSVSHRDLKSPNLMVSEADGEIKIWLVDLVGVRTHTNLSQERKAQNLARLNSSFVNSSQINNPERLRFLRQYLRWGMEGPFTWKAWWRRIGRLTQLKIAKNQKSGRPLA
jgi:tRNA A-37 threonylcarbamoyl transferase component Bud32